MNARETALFVLGRVIKQGSYLNLELKDALRGDMDSIDRRFVTALVSTTVENLYRIDFVISQFVKAKRVHSVIRNILRLGVCQLMYFESVPVSAAVNESVKLAQGAGKKQLKGFVNATLRNIAENLGNVKYPSREKDLIGFLNIFYSYPIWLCEKYVRDYGSQFAEDMMAYKSDSTLTCVRINQFRTEGLEGLEPGKYCEDARYIKNAESIETMPLFIQGKIAVQGEASMICVRSAGISLDDVVMDACAAPGGKSAYAAWLARQGKVVALDIHAHRVELMDKTLNRLAVPNVETKEQDASEFCAQYEEKFDVVLVDAPCSALGLLYRKPDIKISKMEGDIKGLVEVQKKILHNCSKYVKPGGTLLYSTCTINKQENEENAQWFLKNHKQFQAADIKNDVPEELMYRTEGNMLQLFPHIDEIDGFFVARFQKVL